MSNIKNDRTLVLIQSYNLLLLWKSQFIPIIILTMLVQKENLLIKYAKKIRNYEHFEKILQHQDLIFDYKPFKIQKLVPEQALQKYAYLYNKYYVTHEIDFLVQKWHQQEKRLFVWFMVVYSYFLEKEVSSLNPPVNYRHHINFKLIAQLFFEKSSFFIEFQFLNLFKSVDKIVWTEEEDFLLTNSISKFGKTNWSRISKEIFAASDRKKFIPSKYCRQRWQNHLDKSKVRGNWTVQEDLIIIQSVLDPQIGKKWARMKVLLKDRRTQHMIKNRYHSLITKFKTNRFDKEREIGKRILEKLASDLNEYHDSQQVEVAQAQNEEFEMNKQMNLKEQNVSDDQESAQVQNPFTITFEKVVNQDILPQIVKQEEPRIIQANKEPLAICVSEPEEQSDKINDFQIKMGKDSKKQDPNEQEDDQNVFPFNNYNYDDQLRNMSYYSYQSNPMFYYPYIPYGSNVATVPTTDSCNFPQQNNGYFQPEQY